MWREGGLGVQRGLGGRENREEALTVLQAAMKACPEGEMLGMGQGDRSQQHFKIIKRKSGGVSCAKCRDVLDPASNGSGKRLCTSFPSSGLRDVKL